MASKTKTTLGAAGARSAARKRTAARPRARTTLRGEARSRWPAWPPAAAAQRRRARPERVTGGASGSRGIGLADQSDWWLDPRAPTQVAFAPPPAGTGRGSPAAASVPARRRHEPVVTPWAATGSFCPFARKPRLPQTRP